MADRPILFSGPMVRAILDGRKTQTRRPLSGVPEMPTPDCHPRHSPRHEAPYLDAYCSARKTGANPRGMSNDWCWWQVDDRPGKTFRVPHAPGDRLWVRETWAFEVNAIGSMRDEEGPFVYAADKGSDRYRLNPKWTPSIHMPRWASRLTLIVTDVRVQRLQDISDADAMAEGADPLGPPSYTSEPRHIASYANIWDACYGDRAWEANPWVAATTFSAHHCNIDKMEAAG